MKPWIKISLGLLLAASVIAFIVVWDVYLKDKIDSVDVVVVKPGITIDSHEPITESMLAVEKRNRASLIPGTLTPQDVEEIIGFETKYPLIGNMIMSKHFVDFDQLIPNPEKKESIYPIPNEWIYVLPSTLRRKDKIDIYMIQDIGKDGDPNQSRSGSTLTLEQINKLAANDKLSGTRKQELIKLGAIPALLDIPIVYAKDASGNEISTNNSADNKLKATEEERYYSTGVVTNLELLLTEDQYRTILEFIKKGNKMYITYN